MDGTSLQLRLDGCGWENPWLDRVHFADYGSLGTTFLKAKA